MIIRKGLNDYEKTKNDKKKVVTERDINDFDLGFEEDGMIRIYILDAHEKMQMSKNEFAYGPAFFVLDERSGTTYRSEWYVNDPKMWTWIRRLIAEGHINAGNMLDGPAKKESEVVYSSVSV